MQKLINKSNLYYAAIDAAGLLQILFKTILENNNTDLYNTFQKKSWDWPLLTTIGLEDPI